MRTGADLNIQVEIEIIGMTIMAIHTLGARITLVTETIETCINVLTTDTEAHNQLLEMTTITTQLDDHAHLQVQHRAHHINNCNHLHNKTNRHKHHKPCTNL